MNQEVDDKLLVACAEMNDLLDMEDLKTGLQHVDWSTGDSGEIQGIVKIGTQTYYLKVGQASLDHLTALTRPNPSHQSYPKSDIRNRLAFRRHAK